MGYSDSLFSFSPQRTFSFDPSNSKNRTQVESPVPVTQNLYVPDCASQNLVKDTYAKQVQEIANNTGQTISYQPVRYNFNTHSFVYGEDPVSGFHYARKMKAIISFNSYTSFLTKYGMGSEAVIQIFIPFTEFERAWGDIDESGVFPLAGDLFSIDDSACNRPLRQSKMVFRVTDKHDSISVVDFMGGHYVWKIDAERFHYSYEPNAEKENFLDENVSDQNFYGEEKADGTPLSGKYNEYDVDEKAKENYDNTDSSGVYGKYS